MAFSSVLAGSQMVATQVSQIIDALSGTAGGGQAIVLTKLNDASSWALDVANADTTNGYGLRVRDAADNNLLLVYKNTVTVGASAANDTMTLNVNISGKVYLGDSANANMTAGLTINQGANDDEILAFKSSDVAHGITDSCETDTFARFKKATAATGGLEVAGFSEDSLGLKLSARTGAVDATRTTAGVGAFILSGALKTGTTFTTLGADKNILVVQDNATTRFILDSDGDSHQDVGTAWSNFDERDDVALLTALSAEVSRDGDPIRKRFGHFLADRRAELESIKLVTFNDGAGQDGHAFVNMSKLTMLLTGAVRQLGEQNADLRAEITEIRQKLLPEVA